MSVEKISLTVEQAKNMLEASIIAQKTKKVVAQMDETEERYFDKYKNYHGMQKRLAFNFLGQVNLAKDSQEYFSKKGIDLSLNKYVPPKVTAKISGYSRDNNRVFLNADEVRDFIKGFHAYSIDALSENSLDRIDSIRDKDKLDACFNALSKAPVDEFTANGATSKSMKQLYAWVIAEKAMSKEKRDKITANMNKMKNIYMNKHMGQIIGEATSEMLNIGLATDKDKTEHLFQDLVSCAKEINNKDVEAVVASHILNNESNSKGNKVDYTILANPYFRHEAQSVINNSFKLDGEFIKEKAPLIKKANTSIAGLDEDISTLLEYSDKFYVYEKNNKDALRLNGLKRTNNNR